MRASASGWTRTSESTNTRISPGACRAPRLRAAAGPSPLRATMTSSPGWAEASTRGERVGQRGAAVGGRDHDAQGGGFTAPVYRAQPDAGAARVIGEPVRHAAHERVHLRLERLPRQCDDRRGGSREQVARGARAVRSSGGRGWRPRGRRSAWAPGAARASRPGSSWPDTTMRSTGACGRRRSARPDTARRAGTPTRAAPTAGSTPPFHWGRSRTATPPARARAPPARRAARRRLPQRRDAEREPDRDRRGARGSTGAANS